MPTKDFCPSLCYITDTKNPCVLVLTRCHVTDINHVLTCSHVTEINYVDRGAAARAPLQLGWGDELLRSELESFATSKSICIRAVCYGLLFLRQALRGLN